MQPTNGNFVPFADILSVAKYHSVVQKFVDDGSLQEGDPMKYQAINLAQKFSLFDKQLKPKVIAEMNDYQFKIVKFEGNFVWHDHPETDETFIVIEGELRIDFRDGEVTIGAGEMFVVSKGVEHKPYAEKEVKLMLIEPRGILNTGHAGGEITAENDVWI